MTELSTELPPDLYRTDQVRELDRLAIEEFHIDGITLMESAGAATCKVLQDFWSDAKKISVLCGSGNNGGDGYVLARLAHDAGYEIRLVQLRSIEHLQGDAREAANRFLSTGIKPEPFSPDCLSDADVVVDALLGTGLDRNISGDWQTAIECINTSGKPVLSIDIPSGLHADNGRILGVAIKADVTISFIGLKQGLFTGEGRFCGGKILFSDLNVPREIYNRVEPASERITLDQFITSFDKRPRTAHKGDFGHVLVVGGESGFTGAARMTCEAALRVGAGLASLATREAHAAQISQVRPEIMSHGVETPVQLVPLIEKANVIAIGPGLGQSQWALSLLSRVMETSLPIVMDADALNLLAKDPARKDDWILTPHPGEAARLLGCSSSDIQSDRPKAAKELQARYGGVIVLKGSGTVIVTTDGKTSLCDAGNPGMATGGMGDVLTGVIAGLLAQGFDMEIAAKLGVCLHATAGDTAAVMGERGLLPSDLMPEIRRLVNPGRI